MQVLLLNSALYQEIKSTLIEAGREDLVKKLVQSERSDTMTSSQVADILSVSSTNTVKNWLEGGYFPGAYKTASGHWQFPLADVLKTKERLEGLKYRNATRDLLPSDTDDVSEPPLL